MDYLKDRAGFYGILASPGRFVIIEKTISKYSFWQDCGVPYLDSFRQRAELFSNHKLHKLIAIAQGFKFDTVAQQNFEESANLREIERTCAEILSDRREGVISNGHQHNPNLRN